MSLLGRQPAALRHELRPWDALRGWIDADRRQHYVVRCRAHTRTIRVKIAGKWQRVKCHLPDLLAEMVGSVLDGKFRWEDIARIAAVFDRPSSKGRGEPTAATIVHCPPLPNVDGDGVPCMGSIKMDSPEWADLSPLEAFERLFLATDYADHYLGSSLTDQRLKTHRNILTATRRAKGRVPREWLKPLGSYGEVFGGQRPTPIEAEAWAEQDDAENETMIMCLLEDGDEQ